MVGRGANGDLAGNLLVLPEGHRAQIMEHLLRHAEMVLRQRHWNMDEEMSKIIAAFEEAKRYLGILKPGVSQHSEGGLVCLS